MSKSGILSLSLGLMFSHDQTPDQSLIMGLGNEYHGGGTSFSSRLIRWEKISP